MFRILWRERAGTNTSRSKGARFLLRPAGLIGGGSGNSHMKHINAPSPPRADIANSRWPGRGRSKRVACVVGSCIIAAMLASTASAGFATESSNSAGMHRGLELRPLNLVLPGVDEELWRSEIHTLRSAPVTQAVADGVDTSLMPATRNAFESIAIQFDSAGSLATVSDSSGSSASSSGDEIVFNGGDGMQPRENDSPRGSGDTTFGLSYQYMNDRPLSNHNANVSVHAVPLPAPVALSAVGLVSLVVLRKRRSLAIFGR